MSSCSASTAAAPAARDGVHRARVAHDPVRYRDLDPTPSHLRRREWDPASLTRRRESYHRAGPGNALGPPRRVAPATIASTGRCPGELASVSPARCLCVGSERAKPRPRNCYPKRDLSGRMWRSGRRVKKPSAEAASSRHRRGGAPQANPLAPVDPPQLKLAALIRVRPAESGGTKRQTGRCQR